MGLSRVFGFCVALLFAAPVSAAVTIDLGPSDWRRWGDGTAHHHTRGLNTKFGQTVRMPPLNSNLTVTRNAVIPYGSIANGAKNFLRVNPASIAASAAFTGMFLALDWAWDEVHQGWGTYEEQLIEDPALHIFAWGAPGDSEYFAGPTGDIVCSTVFANHKPNYVYTGFNGQTNYCRGYFHTEPWRDRDIFNRLNRVGQCPSNATYNRDSGGCVTIDGEFELVSDSQIRELEDQLPFFPPATVGSAAWDAMERQGAPLNGYSDMQIEGPSSVAGPETTSTSTDPVTGDTVTTSTQTTTNISYGDTTITTTNTTTTNTYTNGTHTSTTTTTETPGELPVTEAAPAGEWPGFCDWAGIVCDWIGWTQEEPPAEPELPQVIDDDFYEEKDISFGAKSCPPDYEITIPFLDTVVAVPMQPFCDFAAIIYYMVMAASYIIAAYITVGVVRNG